MPYFSRNPILAEANAGSPFLKMELEVYIEKTTVLDTYTSLGRFSFVADADGDISERIDSILHAALMSEIVDSLPDAESTAQLVPQLARKFYYRTREYASGAWSSWTDSSTDFVVLGGQPYEEFANTFNSLATSAPTFLHSENSILTINLAQGWVYFLAQSSGTASIVHRYWNKAQSASNTVTTTISVPRDFTVVRIPVVLPAANKSPFFGIEITVDGVTRSIALTSDQRYHKNVNEFAYLSSKGGWNFLPCHAPVSKTIEVAQQTAETVVSAAYYNNDIAQYQVWDSRGRKKMRVATGYWPSAYLDVVIQDFLLSRYRYWYSTEYNKWLPIVVDTKSASYANDMGGDLNSFQFDFKPAFDSDIASPL